jgi:hypothetical protein
MITGIYKHKMFHAKFVHTFMVHHTNFQTFNHYNSRITFFIHDVYKVDIMDKALGLIRKPTSH